MGLLARDYTTTTGWTGTQYYYHDGQGNVRTVVNTAGPNVPAWHRYKYDPFGQITQIAPTYLTVENPYTWKSEPRDASGPIYLRAGNYDPALGRFLSRHPLPGSRWDAQSQNPYAYGGNNPVTRSDPTGMFCTPRTPFD